MPSSEHPQESYLSYLESVEQLITQFDADGPLLLFGDLNAHLGCRGYVNQTTVIDRRGELWNNLISNYNLQNVSLGCLASGPVHIFQSGTNATTIDYVVNQDAMRGVSSCTTLEDRIRSSSNTMYSRYDSSTLPYISCISLSTS